MFTEQDKTNILAVKARIHQRIQLIRIAPYYTPDLPWDKLFLSGGAICSLLNGEEPKDWDWYFKDDAAMYKFQKHLKNCELFIKDVDPKYGDFGINGKMITANAITMDDNNSFITMVAGLPENIKKSFDYVHCTPHYDWGKLYISEKQYKACTNKTLIVNNIGKIKEYRQEKFIKRGWKNEQLQNTCVQ
jgi:hypothetical protein